jgi:hypothetical protein
MVLISYCSMFMYVKDKCWIHLCDVFMLFVCLFCFVLFVHCLISLVVITNVTSRWFVHKQRWCQHPILWPFSWGTFLFASMGIWVCHIGTKRWRLKLRLHTLISMIHHCLTYDFTILHTVFQNLWLHAVWFLILEPSTAGVGRYFPIAFCTREVQSDDVEIIQMMYIDSFFNVWSWICRVHHHHFTTNPWDLYSTGFVWKCRTKMPEIWCFKDL